MRRKKHSLFNEFTVFGAFIAVSILGFLYGGVLLLLAVSGFGGVLDVPSATAPTEEEYQQEVRHIMGSFLGQIHMIGADEIAGAGDDFYRLVDVTQGRMIEIKVPTGSRETHISIVLLLEQWKRAVGGSVADQEAVIGNTRDVIERNPWLIL